jgi:hypothetical protein
VPGFREPFTLADRQSILDNVPQLLSPAAQLLAETKNKRPQVTIRFIGDSMKLVRTALALWMLIPLSVPALADFKYTDTSQITGGALAGMANFAAKFSKDSRAAMQPVATTHYVKGNRLRTDNSDGTVQIIDLDGRRMISIDNQKKTYSVVTFDEMKAAMEKAMQNASDPPPAKKPDAPAQNTQVQVTPKVTVLPGTGTRVILGQNTTETKIKLDMEVQSQNNGQASPTTPPSTSDPAGAPTSVTFYMTMDTYVAPTVPGYQEFGEFYKKMAKEVNWVPPTNIHIDPRMTQGMSEMQKNSASLKGLPLLSYITMGVPTPPNSNQNSAQTSSNSSSNSNSSSSSSSSSVPTSSSDAVVKGLGSLFGKKKQQQDNSQSATPAPPPNPNADPNALMEMTTQVTSFSDSSLDGSLFDIPASYTQVQQSPDQIFNRPAPRH